jgi:ATP-dependent exoDNAse (exonuclease V) alpha subunit
MNTDRIEMATGMKAMIVFNLSTEADIANGTRGTIRDIILDPREEKPKVNKDDLTVHLKHPPALIIFEPEGGSDVSSIFTDKRDSCAFTVPDGHIPITPSSITFGIVLNDGTKISISRSQYALTGGYAFTDIKAQGQTMGTVLIDLRDTPTGKISPFSAYVALSRSRGRDTIRLLSDFDDKLFKTHPNADLAIEMQRLESLAM